MAVGPLVLHSPARSGRVPRAGTVNDSASHSTLPPQHWGANLLDGPISPYPGLRPFDFDEHPIFFGRERHCDEILKRLATSNFVSVIGPSGCGKSSLLNAGVMPQLRAGRFYLAGASWELARMRPQNRPAWNFAAAVDSLHEPVGGSDRVRRLMRLQQELLFDPKAALDEVRERVGFTPNANILIVVDQFEELFNPENYESEAQRDEVQSLVDVLLQIHEGKIDRTYCILTMRSDHLGDCSAFPRLADAVNKTFYLTPNLTEPEQRRAIEFPALQFEGTFEDGLVDRIFRDMQQEKADQLPLMQHALMLMWNAARLAPREADAPVRLTLALYERYGPLADALKKHGDDLLRRFKRLPGSSEPIDWQLVEDMFRQLTERSPGASAQDVRRPTEFSKLAAIIGRTTDEEKAELRFAIDQFRGPEALFLQPFMTDKATIADDQRVDIVHECLIRKWPVLSAWVQAESEAVKVLHDLVVVSKAAKAEHAERVVEARADTATLVRKIASRTPSQQRSWLSHAGTLLQRQAEELRRRVQKDWPAVKTVVQQFVSNTETRRQVLNRAASAPERSFQAARRSLKAHWWQDFEIGDTIKQLRRRGYLKRDDTARFSVWLKSWKRDGRLPNTEWARAYKCKPAEFKDAIAYLHNSRRYNRSNFRLRSMGVGLAIAAGVYGGMWLKFNNDITESKAVETAAKRELENEQKEQKLKEQTRRQLNLQALAGTMHLASTQQVDEEQQTDEQFKNSLDERLQLPDNLKGDSQIRDWVKLQRHVIEAGLVTTLSRQTPELQRNPKRIDGVVKSLSFGGSPDKLVVVTPDHAHFFNKTFDKTGDGVAAPRIDAKDLDIWTDETGRIYWLLLGDNDKPDGRLHIHSPGRAAEVHDTSAGMKVDDYAVTDDYSRIVLVGAANDKGARQVRLIDPQQPSIAKTFEFHLPDGGNAKIRWTSIGGPHNRRIAMALAVPREQQPQQLNKLTALLRVAVWDLSEDGSGSIGPTHDFYTTIDNFENFKDMKIAPDGRALAFVIMPTVNIYVLNEQNTRERSPSKLWAPNNTTHDLLGKGEQLALEFLKSSEIALVTANGWVALWPYLISSKAVPVAPRLDQPRHVVLDSDGNLYAALADGTLQHINLSNQFGRFSLLPDTGSPTASTVISTYAVDKHSGRLVVGRSNGDVEFHALQARAADGAHDKTLEVLRADPKTGERGKIVSAATTELGDKRYITVVLDDTGGLFAAIDGGPQSLSPVLTKVPRSFPNKNRLKLSRDGGQLALLGDQGQIEVLHRAKDAPADGWHLVDAKFPTRESICSIAFSPNAAKVAIGTSQGKVYVSDFANGSVKPWIHVGALKNSAESVTFSADGTFILAGELTATESTGSATVKPCSDAGRRRQTAVVLYSEKGEWTEFHKVIYRQTGKTTFAAATAHPDGNTFQLTGWSRDTALITMVDAEPLGFPNGDMNQTNVTRRTISIKFADLKNMTQELKSSGSLRQQSDVPLAGRPARPERPVGHH
jgi:WD40 repeat protein